MTSEAEELLRALQGIPALTRQLSDMAGMAAKVPVRDVPSFVRVFEENVRELALMLTYYQALRPKR